MAINLDAAKKVFDIIGDVGGYLGYLNLGRFGEGKKGETGEVGIKASATGFGITDESLFWSAVALAKQKEWIDNTGVSNLEQIMSGLTLPEKRRLCRIIGRDEQSITIEVTSKAKQKAQTAARRRQQTNAKDDEKDKGETKKTTTVGNLRGAMTVALLAAMDPNEAVAFLRNSGTLSGPIDDLKFLFTTLAAWLNRTQFGRKALEKVTAGAEKAILWYLGAATLQEAEVMVTTKETRLRERREQSWYERDLQQRPVLPKVWIALVVFIAIGALYVFSH